MILARLIVIATFVSIIALSCSASKQEQSASAQGKGKALTPPSPLAPNTCRLIGTIVEIEPKLADADPKDPCSKAPCFAVVRIDSVVGYGSAFPTSLGVGATMRTRFAHTLGATKDLLPEVSPPLPGLHAGSRFKADVSATTTLGSKEPSFTIYVYEVLR
jgi:hypothetical protein